MHNGPMSHLPVRTGGNSLSYKGGGEDVGVRSVRNRCTSDLDHILTDCAQGAQWRLLALSLLVDDRLEEVA